MVNQYAFFINSDACSGCKTCQIACNDKNDIPEGVHWRRVYEVTGGSWEKKDGAWSATVVAYNLSMSCVHCIDAVCLSTCPSQVIWKRDDGIVLIDDTRCSRCRRCESACPYNAIRYDPVTDSVRKCHFCVDYLDVGLLPACVAACPNRAIDCGDYADMIQKYGNVSRVFPLPDPAIARPGLVIKPHRNAALVQSRDPEVANWGEL